MNIRSLFALLMIAVLCTVGFISQSLIAETDSTSVTDPEQLGRVAREWAYPEDNTISIDPAIGRPFPLHVVVVQTDDPFDDVCQYYASKCGGGSFDDIDVSKSGESDSGIYLIRDNRADTSAAIPRVIFMHDNNDHTVSVTVMRPNQSSQTQIDLSVAVR